ncbi:MAG: tetratricopeptide repeat protein, partial [Acidobacteria bacterium]|nr:tetratricopeptide repeat protein [Acidobacteriota bacterium]
SQRQYPAAQTDIERAVSLSPRNAHYLAGRALLFARTLPRKFDPTAFLEKRLTFSEEEVKALEAAARYYQRALALNPLDDGNYHNLGWLYSLLQQREPALRCFQQAITIDNSVALYHVSLGLLYEQGGEHESAHREYELAVRLSPSVLDSQFFRDLSARSPGSADRVAAQNISHLEQQPGLSQSPILKGRLGKLYLHANRLDAASAALRDAVKKLPSLPRPWHNLGDVYEREGDEEAARECYQKATLLDGGDAAAWWKLGRLLERRGDKQGAVRSYARAARGWRSMTSEHAKRVSRIYRSQPAVPDDVIPNGFLSYCNPSIDVAEVCLRLARLYEELGDRESSHYYKELCARLTD